MKERDLRKLCEAHGSVVSVRLINSRSRGGSKGYGFVHMASAAEGKALIQALNGKEVRGRRLVASEARSRTRAR